MEKQLKLFEIFNWKKWKEKKKHSNNKPKEIKIIRNAYMSPEGLIREEIVIKRFLLKFLSDSSDQDDPSHTPLFLIKSQN